MLLVPPSIAPPSRKPPMATVRHSRWVGSGVPLWLGSMNTSFSRGVESTPKIWCGVPPEGTIWSLTMGIPIRGR